MLCGKSRSFTTFREPASPAKGVNYAGAGQSMNGRGPGMTMEVFTVGTTDLDQFVVDAIKSCSVPAKFALGPATSVEVAALACSWRKTRILEPRESHPNLRAI